MLLTVVDRYLLREILYTWAAVVAVLLLIVLTNALVYMLGHVLEGRITGEALMPLFVTSVLGRILVNMMPVSLYLALLLVFGRLYSESEMAALNACGVGPRQLYRPVMVAALIGVLLTGSLSLWIAPWANRVEHDIEVQLEARSELAGVAAGRFNRAVNDQVTLFASRRDDDGTLHGIFVKAAAEGERPVVIRAERAIERTDDDTGWRYVEFQQGVRYSGKPGTAEFDVIEFERHGMRLPEQRIDAGRVSREGRTLRTLLDSDRSADAAEFQWRVSIPIACIVLALAALPLARTAPRKGRYSRIAIALLVYVVYANAMVVARDAVSDGTIPPILGLWWAHALSFLIVGAMIARFVGWRWAIAVLGGRAETR